MSNTIQPTPEHEHLLVEARLADTRRLVEPMQRSLLNTLPAQIRDVVGFHLGWRSDDGGELLGGCGLAVRPSLTLSCARAVGGSAHAAVPAAIAVELVHEFSSLHDEITAGTTTWRHRPPAWVVFGIPKALLAGDAMLVLAFDLISGGMAGEALRAAALELIAGESDDLAMTTCVNLSLPQCVRMAEQRTGALFGAACQLGALSVTDDIRIAGLYRQFGRQLGISVQLIDDIFGIWGSRAANGKPFHSDLASGKKSLPVVAALASGTAASRELAEMYSSNEQFDDQQLIRAADLIDEAGGRAWAETTAENCRAAAFDALAEAQPEALAANELLALSEILSTTTV